MNFKLVCHVAIHTLACCHCLHSFCCCRRLCRHFRALSSPLFYVPVVASIPVIELLFRHCHLQFLAASHSRSCLRWNLCRHFLPLLPLVFLPFFLSSLSFFFFFFIRLKKQLTFSLPFVVVVCLFVLLLCVLLLLLFRSLHLLRFIWPTRLTGR